jgi:hypothetical protein
MYIIISYVLMKLFQEKLIFCEAYVKRQKISAKISRFAKLFYVFFAQPIKMQIFMKPCISI